MIRRPTSRDVAAAAGVSQPTVSRALRGDPSVSAETRARVTEAAQRLDYMLDRRGSKLRFGRTGVLAVVILGMPDQPRAAANPFYLVLLGAIAAAAADRGYDTLVSFQGAPDTFRAGFRQGGDADGIIVVGSARNSAAWAFYAGAATAGEPIVCWGAPDDALPTVRCDNRSAATMAVRHLIDGGRMRIAFLGGGWERQTAYADRRSGYLDALAQVGMAPIEAPELPAPSREEEGCAATLALLDVHPRIDAIFAASDLLAIGAIRAARLRNKAIPDDIALVGFDGILSASHVSPSLTTVEQDTAAAGEALVSTLISLIEDRPAPSPSPEVPMRLAIRESSASPKIG